MQKIFLKVCNVITTIEFHGEAVLHLKDHLQNIFFHILSHLLIESCKEFCALIFPGSFLKLRIDLTFTNIVFLAEYQIRTATFILDIFDFSHS